MTRTMGTIISEARKARGMTQIELAEAMNVTDKAVSKWERDISCPDLASISKLGETLGIGVEELLSGKSAPGKGIDLFNLVCLAVGLAMGVAVAVLSMLSRLNMTLAAAETEDFFGMIGVGILALALPQLKRLGE